MKDYNALLLQIVKTEHRKMTTYRVRYFCFVNDYVRGKYKFNTHVIISACIHVYVCEI